MRLKFTHDDTTARGIKIRDVHTATLDLCVYRMNRKLLSFSVFSACLIRSSDDEVINGSEGCIRQMEINFLILQHINNKLYLYICIRFFIIYCHIFQSFSRNVGRKINDTCSYSIIYC